jgi:hypothetical protein
MIMARPFLLDGRLFLALQNVFGFGLRQLSTETARLY